jgi:hypothetical protein
MALLRVLAVLALVLFIRCCLSSYWSPVVLTDRMEQQFPMVEKSCHDIILLSTMPSFSAWACKEVGSVLQGQRSSLNNTACCYGFFIYLPSLSLMGSRGSAKGTKNLTGPNPFYNGPLLQVWSSLPTSVSLNGERKSHVQQEKGVLLLAAYYWKNSQKIFLVSYQRDSCSTW